MPEALTKEEVFANDIDPLDAIRELRKGEGVPEEDLPTRDTMPSDDIPEETTIPEKGPESDDLDAFQPDPTPEVPVTEVPVETAPKSTVDDVPPIEEPSDTDGLPTEEGKETEKSTVSAEKLTFKANGQDFEFTPEEVVAQFETVFGQAMDYTQKMQKIAPYRKMISALEEEGISQDQLNVAIDALKGNKEAIQQILKTNEMDTYDLNTASEEGEYTPTPYGKTEDQLGIEEVFTNISTDPEYKITADVIDNQWDQESRNAFTSNPKMIQGLHNDIKTGIYDKVAPMAMKMKVLDGNAKSDIQYYMLAGEQLRLQSEKTSQQTVDDVNRQTQDAVKNSDQASSEAQRKRAATSTRVRADRKGVIDYLDDDDVAFDAWYKETMSQ